MMIVAAAGPLANLVLAFASAAFVSYSLHRGAGAGEGGVVDGVVYLLGNYLFPINLALFVFNMLPIYPLDGQKVAAGLLSGDTSMRFERFSRQYGTLVLWGIIIFGHQILALPFHWTRQGVLHLVGLG
jgi:Zn-dependent protease